MNIAKENLIQKPRGYYTPCNPEILKETLKITEADNYTLDQDGWYSDPMLQSRRSIANSGIVSQQIRQDNLNMYWRILAVKKFFLYPK